MSTQAYLYDRSGSPITHRERFRHMHYIVHDSVTLPSAVEGTLVSIYSAGVGTVDYRVAVADHRTALLVRV